MAKQTVTKADLLKRVASLERVLSSKRGPGRPRSAPANMIPTGKFTLEVTTPEGKRIRQFKSLSRNEFEKYRRDFYKLLVIGMKQKITMNKIVEYRRAE
jgi:hypothetical protein